MRRTMVALAVLAASGGVARAAPATPEEAQRLVTLLQRYVGAPAAGKPGPVSVVPHGDAYTATFDVTRMLSFLSATGADFTAGDLVAELAPQADGLWHVTIDGFPPLGVNQGSQALSFTISNYMFDGLFDPKIETFASSTTTTHGSSTHVRGDQPVDIKLADTGAGTTKAADAGAGTVNAGSTGAYKDIDYRIAAAQSATSGAAEPVELGHLRAAALGATMTVEHAPIIALNDLWQFLVAHPSKPALAASQGQLKTRLKALVPLASASTSGLTLSGLAVDTSLGTFALDEFGAQDSFSAADAGGISTTTLKFGGLALPAGLVPGWAAPLVPKSLDLTQTYGPLNATPALLMAIDDLDLAADKPLTDDQLTAIMTALGSDDMTLTIAPSSLATPTLTLSFEGKTRLQKPTATGSGLVKATGLDKTMEAVRSAAPGDATGLQAIAALMAAKALAKAEGPDSYSWAIVAGPGGDVTVNGNSLSGMMSKPGSGAKPRKTTFAP